MTAFRPHLVWTWSRPTLSEWQELLTHRYIYIYPDRNKPVTEVLVNITYRERNISSSESIEGDKSETGKMTSS